MAHDRTFAILVTGNAVLDKPDGLSDGLVMDDIFSDTIWPKVRALAEARGWKSDTILKWRLRGKMPGDKRLILAGDTEDEAVRSALLTTSLGGSAPDNGNAPPQEAIAAS